jgi:hypothetical protein
MAKVAATVPQLKRSIVDAAAPDPSALSARSRHRLNQLYGVRCASNQGVAVDDLSSAAYSENNWHG